MCIERGGALCPWVGSEADTPEAGAPLAQETAQEAPDAAEAGPPLGSGSELIEADGPFDIVRLIKPNDQFDTMSDYQQKYGDPLLHKNRGYTVTEINGVRGVLIFGSSAWSATSATAWQVTGKK